MLKELIKIANELDQKNIKFDLEYIKLVEELFQTSVRRPASSPNPFGTLDINF